MRIDVLSIFPEVFATVLATSIPGRAASSGRVSYHLTDIRRFADNKHDKVDDRPFGGGPGMVMYAEPLARAVEHAEADEPTRAATRVLLTPQGELLDQRLVSELAARDRLLLIAGHYEGVDERAIEELQPREISIGDYVLSGGELAAMVLIDAVVRLVPGVLGHADSAAEDSFSHLGPEGQPLLDCPHYTRPRVWRGRDVPEVLLSGDHGAVERWRMQQMIKRTRDRRPDLWRQHSDTPKRHGGRGTNDRGE
jgi:tRNA (guanine37-N1)-methyltransferase